MVLLMLMLLLMLVRFVVNNTVGFAIAIWAATRDFEQERRDKAGYLFNFCWVNGICHVRVQCLFFIISHTKNRFKMR